MNYEKNKFYPLSTISKDRGVLKSQLLYYVQLGLLLPAGKSGKTLLFDGLRTITILDAITEYKKRGLSLKEIKNRVLPTL